MLPAKGGSGAIVESFATYKQVARGVAGRDSSIKTEVREFL
jgi:hypothetical protein